MNQSELAEQIGAGAEQRHVSRIERGLPAGLSSAQLGKLFKVLQMTKFRRQRDFLKWWQGQKV
jgi:transcriptional regulator with XRE-family HTH domain